MQADIAHLRATPHADAIQLVWGQAAASTSTAATASASASAAAAASGDGLTGPVAGAGWDLDQTAAAVAAAGVTGLLWLDSPSPVEGRNRLLAAARARWPAGDWEYIIFADGGARLVAAAGSEDKESDGDESDGVGLGGEHSDGSAQGPGGGGGGWRTGQCPARRRTGRAPGRRAVWEGGTGAWRVWERWLLGARPAVGVPHAAGMDWEPDREVV